MKKLTTLFSLLCLTMALTIPASALEYADDFVIVTNTRAHAEDWKTRLQTFLQNKMKLIL